MPTNGFSTKPLKVKLLAGEQKATKFSKGLQTTYGLDREGSVNRRRPFAMKTFFSPCHPGFQRNRFQKLGTRLLKQVEGGGWKESWLEGSHGYVVAQQIQLPTEVFEHLRRHPKADSLPASPIWRMNRVLTLSS